MDSYLKLVVSVVLGVLGIFANPVLGGGTTPEHYKKMFVYESSVPFYSPDGLFFVDGFATGDASNFHKNIMNRSDEEIEEQKQEALEFFAARFGMYKENPSLLFTSVEVMPEIDYQVVFSSGEKVPEQGWQVRDAAWVFAVVNPEGMVLGGEFEGIHVPMGSMVAYGEYNIRKTRKNRRAEENMRESKRKNRRNTIHIKYQSLRPIVPDADGVIILACELFNEKYGEGQALGIVFPFELSDGRTVMNIRNTLTFPKWGLEVPDDEGWTPAFPPAN